ncbi:MerR family transcriptional regulator [Vibrio astriarenae]|uniref:MerR family transcriptional regulator n=1 Tax=Vibrio astriarenae TaxID=1481923 RepID=UPI0037360AF0
MGCESKKYAIREISELTGVKPVTLRAWQRRYSLIQPERTDKGHRLYTEAHLDIIKEIQGWLARGVAIGKVKDLLGNPDIAPNIDEPPQALEHVEPILTALAEIKAAKVDSLVSSAFKDYPLQQVEDLLIAPVMEALIRVKGSSRSVQKALFQSVMLGRLSSIIESENKAAHKGHTLVVNLDMTGSVYAWLWCMKIAETGQRVTMLDGVDDPAGLLDIGVNFSQLSLFSNRALPEATKETIAQLKLNWENKLVCSPMIEHLM